MSGSSPEHNDYIRALEVIAEASYACNRGVEDGAIKLTKQGGKIHDCYRTVVKSSEEDIAELLSDPKRRSGYMKLVECTSIPPESEQ